MINLYSDTQTRPTEAMRQAMDLQGKATGMGGVDASAAMDALGGLGLGGLGGGGGGGAGGLPGGGAPNRAAKMREGVPMSPMHMPTVGISLSCIISSTRTLSCGTLAIVATLMMSGSSLAIRPCTSRRSSGVLRKLW